MQETEEKLFLRREKWKAQSIEEGLELGCTGGKADMSKFRVSVVESRGCSGQWFLQ